MADTIHNLKFLAICAVFFLASACSDRKLEWEIIKIFEGHSSEKYPSKKISELWRVHGVDGLTQLDSHIAIVTAHKTFKPMQGPSGGGSGIIVTDMGGDLHVAEVFPGSPASKAGIRAGDKLLQINSMRADGSTLAAVRQKPYDVRLQRLVRGLRTTISISVSGGDFEFPMNFSFYNPLSRTRYFRLGLFYGGSARELMGAFKAFYAEGGKKIIFDLRNNIGGMPAEATEILKLFAPGKGVLLEFKSRHEGYCRRFEAAGRGELAGVKVVVLVNKGTAMTAEVFAASLRSLANAAIAGEKTQGNVSLQKTFKLGDSGKGLSLTIARLFPASGEDLEGAGLKPDMPVLVPEKQAVFARELWNLSGETVLLNDPVYTRAVQY